MKSLTPILGDYVMTEGLYRAVLSQNRDENISLMSNTEEFNKSDRAISLVGCSKIYVPRQEFVKSRGQEK